MPFQSMHVAEHAEPGWHSKGGPDIPQSGRLSGLDRLIPPIEPLPSIINIGHGKGAHAIWAEHTAYYPPALLCMRPCKGGFPFCPPPCCWCIAPGCLTCCGYCGGEAEGEGTAMFVESTLLPFEMRRTLGKGAGVLPPEAMEMSRLPL